MFAKHETGRIINLNMRMPWPPSRHFSSHSAALSLYQRFIPGPLLQVIMQEEFRKKVQRKIIDQIWIVVALLQLDPLQTHIYFFFFFFFVDLDDKLPIWAFEHSFHIIPDSFIHICNGFHLSPSGSDTWEFIRAGLWWSNLNCPAFDIDAEDNSSSLCQIYQECVPPPSSFGIARYGSLEVHWNLQIVLGTVTRSAAVAAGDEEKNGFNRKLCLDLSAFNCLFRAVFPPSMRICWGSISSAIYNLFTINRQRNAAACCFPESEGEINCRNSRIGCDLCEWSSDTVHNDCGMQPIDAYNSSIYL